MHVLESAHPRIDFASHIIFMLFDGHGGTLISYTPQYFFGYIEFMNTWAKHLHMVTIHGCYYRVYDKVENVP